MDTVKVEQKDTSHIRFLFLKAPACDRVVFEAENLSKTYTHKPVLHNLNFVIQRKEKVVFVGRNGEGKTTLVRILQGELEQTSGSLTTGQQVKIGYYAQNQNGLLDPQKTVLETIDDIATGEIRTKVRSILGSFLFDSDDIEKKVSVLSGGEKARLALAKLLLESYNVLILDEPTNHLDMISKDILKNALLHYDGTLILVSHDRDFLQGLTEKVMEFKDGHIKTYLGDVGYYLEKKQTENMECQQTAQPKDTTGGEEKASASKLSYEQQKQQEARHRKTARKIARKEESINQLEARLNELSAQLSDGSVYANAVLSEQLCAEYENLRQQLDQTMKEWESMLNEANLP
jgi:ATP-binding cassette subfamily F protein 3